MVDKILDPYRDFIIEQISEYPEITSAIIDRIWDAAHKRGTTAISRPYKIRRYNTALAAIYRDIHPASDICDNLLSCGTFLLA